jgi:transcriptional regulator with XRE-family HTH domain
MSTLSAAVATELKRILSERNLSVSQAARDIRVTRQAFHNYLNETSVPRHKTLSRAMDLWDFRLKIGDTSFDRTSSPRPSENERIAEQLPLIWESLDSIKQQDLKISVAREGSTLKVEVKIDIPA